MRKQTRIYLVVLGLLIASGLTISVRANSAAVPKPTPLKTVEAEYKRLVALRYKLAKIPMERLDREPHKSFVKRNQKDIVYSDPAGQWFVRSDRFWRLAERNRTLAIAHDIAWTAAENPLPGECEGYVNCYVYGATETLGRYLKSYPKGKHTKQALSDLAARLDGMAGDPGTYDGPADASDKAELHKMLTGLQSILAKVPAKGTDKALAVIKKLSEAYK